MSCMIVKKERTLWDYSTGGSLRKDIQWLIMLCRLPQEWMPKNPGVVMGDNRWAKLGNSKV